MCYQLDPRCELQSTVAVYQFSDNQGNVGDDGWRVGFRVSNSPETPCLVVKQESGDTYLMSDGFNENFQHCVVAGTSPRFSSTHRKVVVMGCD